MDHQRKLKIDDYEVIKEIDQGSFGKIYHVRKEGTNKEFAIKKIEKKKISSEKMKAYFDTEVSIMNEIMHERILHLYELLESKNTYYLVVDYCNGGNLKKKLSQFPSGFPEVAAVDYLRQIIEGFQVLRDHSILHRDFKLENILLRNNSVVIGDFGYAKQGETVADSFVGTPMMMAPEILENNATAYDYKADLWSVGLIFYEMLFGENIFFDSDRSKMLKKIGMYSGKSLPFQKEISKEAQHFLRGVLQPDVNSRFDWETIVNHPLVTGNSHSNLKRSNSRITYQNLEQLSVIYKPIKSKKVDENSNMIQNYSKEDILQAICMKFKQHKNTIIFFTTTIKEAKEVRLRCPSSDLICQIEILRLILTKKAVAINQPIYEGLKSKQVQLASPYFDSNIFFNSPKYESYLTTFESNMKELRESLLKYRKEMENFLTSNELQIILLHNAELTNIDIILRQRLHHMKDIVLKSKLESDYDICFGRLICRAFYCLNYKQMLEFINHETNEVQDISKICNEISLFGKDQIREVLRNQTSKS